MQEDERNKKENWFPAKSYGWGWGLPRTWQGWVVMIVWFAVVMVGNILMLGRWPTSVVPFLIFTTVMAVLLIAICWIKGDKPRWRWGGQ